MALRKLSLSLLIPLCMLVLYLGLVVGEYFYESQQVKSELIERQLMQIKQQLNRMQNVVQSAQALQDVERIEQEVSFAALNTNTMVYILLDANGRIRFANHTVWRNSNAFQVIDGYDPSRHQLVVQSASPYISTNLERLTIQAYYPVLSQYRDGVELIYLEIDLAPLVAEAASQLQKRFLQIWGIGGLFLLGFTLLLNFLFIRPIQKLSESAKQLGSEQFVIPHSWGAAEIITLQESLVEVHQRLGRAVKQLNDSEQRWLFAVEDTRHGIWDWNIATGEVFLSDHWKEMVGFQPDELEGVFQVWESRLHAEDKASVLNSLEAYVNGTTKAFESVHRLRHRDGHYLWVLDRGMLVDWDAQGRPTRMIGINIDVSESAKNYAAIAELVAETATDRHLLPAALTTRLTERLMQSRELGHCNALFLVELDHLAITAVSQSEDIDRLLSQVSARLSSYFSHDVFVGHLASGTFVLFATALAEDVELAARRALALGCELRQVIARPLHAGESVVELKASVGIYLLDSIETVEPAQLLHRADLALQQAKLPQQQGCAFYHADLDVRLNSAALLQSTLSDALANDALSVVYQPVIGRHGNILSAEALLRWYKPNGEIVPPVEFIAVAEVCGLIIELDLWVVKQVCLLLQATANNGQVLPRITINISPLSFSQSDFAERIVQLCRRYQVPSNKLGIELSEAALHIPQTYLMTQLKSLNDVGIDIVLDKLGVDNCELRSLALPYLTAVKLDIHCAAALSSTSMWPQAIIAAAQQFNLPVVAKGVESAAQYQAFMALDCYAFQGYFFSRALNQTDFLQFITPSPSPLLRSV